MEKFISKEELIKLVDDGISFKECLIKLNVSSRTLKKYRKLYGLSLDRITKDLKGNCEVCGTLVEYKSTKEKRVYCSEYCSHKREHSEETKQKISKSLIKDRDIKFCINCNVDISMKRSKNKFCSRSCSSKYNVNTIEGKNRIRLMVEKSVLSQSRRSKNEILFFEKCKSYFNNVDNNKIIFNGWDADIIIYDYKIAVLWNGIWHYEKIYKKQSLEQIQNRDSIKIKEILNCGYIPYIIKDMGKHSVKKVDEEFSIFIDYLTNKENLEYNDAIESFVKDKLPIKRLGLKMVSMLCPSCKEIFDKPLNQTFIQKSGKYTCCSVKCSSEIKSRSLTIDELIEIGKNEIIKYYRK